MAAGAAGHRGAPIETPEGAQSAPTDEERAVAQAAAAEQASKDRSGNFLAYTGHTRSAKDGGTIANISVSQWGELGCPGKVSHEWNLGNDFRLPVSQFTDAQIDYLLNRDPVYTKRQRFELVDADGNTVDHKKAR